MANLLDYLRIHLDGFDDRPFCALDAAALSQITMLKAPALIPALFAEPEYADPKNIVGLEPAPHRARIPFTGLLKAEYFRKMLDGKPAWGDRELNLYAVAASPRFRDVTVGDYLSVFDRAHAIQFAAMTFLADDFGVVSYRGTDSTLTGWKEDCNMSYAAPVPAQDEAVRFLETVVAHLPEQLYVIGHSKGGNLAEYATLKAGADVRKRIVRTYNLDGPGFKEGMFTAADYAPVIDRIVKIVPVDDIIGILLHSPVKLHAVASNAKGFAEHSVFTWQLDPEDTTQFQAVAGISPDAQFAGQVIGQWLAKIDDAQREALLEAIFRILGNSSSLATIFSSGFPAIAGMLQRSAPTDPKDVATILSAGKALVDTAADVAQSSLRQPKR